MKTAYITKPEAEKKHRPFILAIDNSYFETQLCSRDGSHALAFGQSLNPYSFEDFVKDVQSHLVIREREYLDESVELNETRPREANGAQPKGCIDYRQVLPYIVPRQRQADGTWLYFPYRRTKQVGESRLAGNGSVGRGGHVDLADVVQGTDSQGRPDSIIDFYLTITQNVLRESDEEFEMVDGMGGVLPIEFDMIEPANLFITDSSASVHQVHVAVVMYLEVPFGYTLCTKEPDELKDLPAATLDQMLADSAFKPELWTELLLNFWNHPVIRRLDIDHGGETVAEVSEATYLAVSNEMEASRERLANLGQWNSGDSSHVASVINNQDGTTTVNFTDNKVAAEVDREAFESVASEASLSDKVRLISPDSRRTIRTQAPTLSGSTLVDLSQSTSFEVTVMGTDEVKMATTEAEATRLGRAGVYPVEGTAPELAHIQNAAANAYHVQAGHFELGKVSPMSAAEMAALDALDRARPIDPERAKAIAAELKAKAAVPEMQAYASNHLETSRVSASVQLNPNDPNPSGTVASVAASYGINPDLLKSIADAEANPPLDGSHAVG